MANTHYSLNDRIFFCFQIILFEGSETSKRDFLLRDSLGRFMSRLIVRRIEHSHAGLYTCQPASAQPATVTVHVLNGTVLAVADGNHRLYFKSAPFKKALGVERKSRGPTNFLALLVGCLI
jgi:hypothetical protein